MAKEMKDVVQAIYELTINPSATPSNWENLAEDVQVAITTKNEKDLLKELGIEKRFSVSVINPDPDVILNNGNQATPSTTVDIYK